jgi:TPR repeat protein
LGVIYKQGGKGIKANWELSRKYFKLAIEHGDKTYAPKNLQDLENQIKKNQKRSRYY